MMLAIPVDSPQYLSHSISEHFSLASYFALFDLRGQHIETIVNQARGQGQSLSRLLAGYGVAQVVFRQLGDRLFGRLNREGIESLAVLEPRMPIAQVIRAVRERTLVRVTDANFGRLLHPSGQGCGSGSA